MNHRFERHGLLGTVVTVTIGLTDSSGHSSRTAAHEAARTVFDEIERLESVFTAHDEDSEFCRWRRGAVADPSPELTAVLAASLDWQRRSGGLFNPLIGVLSDRWSEAAAAGIEPSSAELAALALAVAAPRYDVHDSQVSVRGDCSAMTLNAVAKGAIVDAAVNLVAPVPGRRGPGWAVTVGAGGDVLHRGASRARVGIENPHRPYDNEPPLAVLEVDGALATSGGARRGVRVGSQWQSHVIDPRTGRPSAAVASTSAAAHDALTADVVATVCSVLTPDEAVAWVDSIDEAEAFIVADDASIVTSDGFWRCVDRVR